MSMNESRIQAIQAALKEAGLEDESKELFSAAGIPIRALYTPLDIRDTDYLEDLGLPGSPPYTRGVYRKMYRNRAWTQRQVAGFGTGEETNQRLRYLNRQGQTGLNIVPDHPDHLRPRFGRSAL